MCCPIRGIVPEKAHLLLPHFLIWHVVMVKTSMTHEVVGVISGVPLYVTTSGQLVHTHAFYQILYWLKGIGALWMRWLLPELTGHALRASAYWPKGGI